MVKIKQKTGLLIAQEKLQNGKLRCQCICGNLIDIDEKEFSDESVKHCGCVTNGATYNIKDLRGMRFGRLSVLYRAPNGKTRHVKWHCLCDCGNECDVYKNALLKGLTTSCGCYNKEVKSRICPRKKNVYDLTHYSFGIGYTHNTNNPFYFDLEDYDKIKNFCWREDALGYITTVGLHRKSIYLHSLIMNAPPGMDVDHIGHNVKDNRKIMLRVVPHAQNKLNNKISKNNKSGTTGVWRNKEGKYEAYISYNKKKYHLGKYSNKKDAIAARKAAEKKFFGEYSYDVSMEMAERNKIKE